MVWGPGAIVTIINVLPFAGVFMMNLGWRRYNILGLHPHANSKTFYRRWWVRAFFGRFNYIFLPICGFLFVARSYNNQKEEKTSYAELTSEFLHEMDKFDDEENIHAHRVMAKTLYEKRYKDVKEMILQYRAKRDHDLKIEAFNQYAKEYDF
jgi:hypothetical protein